MRDGKLEPNESVDQIMRILSDGDRRQAIRILAASETPLSLPTLAGRVADSSDEPTSDDALQIRLHHQHLPMLAKVGVVDYDPAAGIVSLTKRGEDVDDVWLGFAEEFDHHTKVT